jgi:hypothetical protein
MIRAAPCAEPAVHFEDPAALPVSQGAHSLEQFSWNLGLSEVVE